MTESISYSEYQRELMRYDPIYWAEYIFGIKLDQWQKEALESTNRRELYNCSRQAGKSTIAALKALHAAIYDPPQLIILISPSLRQSSELFRKVMDYYYKLPKNVRLALTEENKLSLTMDNGSRIVSLPSTESTIRGYSNVSMIIEDEAARVDDELFNAVLPMLAVSNGSFILLSTPNGKHGHFWESWKSDEWRKTTIPVSQVDRISKEFQDSVRLQLGSLIYSQEFECQFTDTIGGAGIKREWWKFYDDNPGKNIIIQSWDTAFKLGEENDFSVCTTWSCDSNYIYLLDCYIDRLDFPALKRMALSLFEQYLPDAIIIEDKASGQSLIQELKQQKDRILPIIAIQVDRDKSIRLNAVSPLIEAGLVYLPRNMKNLNIFIEQLADFPNAEHDDIVDSTSQALQYLKRHIQLATFNQEISDNEVSQHSAPTIYDVSMPSLSDFKL